MSKRNTFIYWIATIWLLSGVLSSGVLQLVRSEGEGTLSPPGVYGITHLGYPVYFLTILGVWKILGTIVLLIPKFPLLKEWAYAGIFFTMSGAVFSHIEMSDTFRAIFPSVILLILTVISWYFRPPSRKLILS